MASGYGAPCRGVTPHLRSKQSIPMPSWDKIEHDTFSVPPATDIGQSSLKVIIPFTYPVIVGKFVYHCHAVDHEDKGMMGVIEVVA
jgi:suppressor of ftsI